ncbi:MAG TPA: arabinofuranosidase catalytic domain-containing protein [Polyangiaceae bacterium]
MQKGHLGVVVGLMLAGAAASTGCSDDTTQQSSDGANNPTSGGQTTGATGTQSNTSGATVSGSTTGGALNCSNVPACGGNAVGTWNVASSCLAISGDMNVLLSALACPTVPATGSLQTSGTFVLNEDGTYADNTTTIGSVSFPLNSSCLAISGVPVTCSRAANIFSALGWKTATCSEANGQCSCSLSTEQQGGMGAIVPFTDRTGQYTAEGDTLTVSNVTYSYCSSGDTLSVTPQVMGQTGTIVLQREGSDGMSSTTMSGMSSTSAGGMSSSSMGSMSSTGAGGASSTSMGGTGGAGGSGGAGGTGGITATGPCDIYAAANHTCVAAHSTVRALFGAYAGPLYQVKRASDGTTQDIPVLTPGGFADSSVQDAFCTGTTCTITKLYDQSGHDNFLEAQTPDSSVGGFQGQTAANASAEQLTVGGHQVYSLYTRPAQAYWNDGSSSGMPIGAEPQGVYMVTSGEHFNGGCCYNYGNGQTSRTYEGGPTMDSVYFGNCTIWGTGAGDGPWVMADMEDGIVSGSNTSQNPNLESLPFPYVTAMEKNNGTTEFAIKGASATAATLNTYYQGALPAGKNPMKKEGAVLLGAGGDCCYSNNNASEGTFYEGAIVSGYPSDATDDAIHANIVETGYGQ